MAEDLQQLLEDALAERRGAELFRARAAVRPLDATHVEIDGRRYVNFCSNNYLGLTHHPAVVEAMTRATRDYGTGSGAAGLISGNTTMHAEAESTIARWKGTEAAVLLPSGYQANHAAVQAIAAAGARRAGGVRFIVDKLVHASLLDAVRGTGLEMRVFPHNGLTKLRRLLKDRANAGLDVVVTESIFSMDGDAADLVGLARLKAEQPFALVVDEAHASGVYGSAGAGYANELGVGAAVDVTILTLSKALGCVGGAVCGSRALCDAVVNFGRAYIFSTSLPPAVAAASTAAIDVLRDEPGRRQRVRELAGQVRARLIGAGMQLPEGDSPIIPVILGDEGPALRAAERLREQGMLVVAVRPPTVPRGSSRLRVTLSSEHTDKEVEELGRALEMLR